MAIVTLTQARRNLAELLGGYRLFTTGVQANPPSGSYVGVSIVDGTEKRKIVSSDLVLLDVSGTTTPAAADRWKYAAVYIPSVPIQRTVAEKGYGGAKLASDVTDQSGLTTTYVGQITLAEQLGSALAAGVVGELHGVMPPISREQGRGLHACINRALRNMSFRDVLPFTTVSGAGRYDVSANTWITRNDQLIGVFDSESDAALQAPALNRGGEIVFDAQSSYLQIATSPASTPFYAAFHRPIGSWVRTGAPGTWADSTVGLVNETDAVFVDPDRLAVCSMYYACEALARAWRADPAGEYWAQERDQKRAVVAQLLMFDSALAQRPPQRGTSGALTRLAGSSRRSWP